MKLEIDLHGFTHDEAVLTVENCLITESLNNDHLDVTIITGYSGKMQQVIIDRVLDLHGFDYFIPAWNPGIIIVK